MSTTSTSVVSVVVQRFRLTAFVNPHSIVHVLVVCIGAAFLDLGFASFDEFSSRHVLQSVQRVTSPVLITTDFEVTHQRILPSTDARKFSFTPLADAVEKTTAEEALSVTQWLRARSNGNSGSGNNNTSNKNHFNKNNNNNNKYYDDVSDNYNGNKVKCKSNNCSTIRQSLKTHSGVGEETEFDAKIVETGLINRRRRRSLFSRDFGAISGQNDGQPLSISVSELREKLRNHPLLPRLYSRPLISKRYVGFVPLLSQQSASIALLRRNQSSRLISLSGVNKQESKQQPEELFSTTRIPAVNYRKDQQQEQKQKEQQPQQPLLLKRKQKRQQQKRRVKRSIIRPQVLLNPTASNQIENNGGKVIPNGSVRTSSFNISPLHNQPFRDYVPPQTDPSTSKLKLKRLEAEKNRIAEIRTADNWQVSRRERRDVSRKLLPLPANRQRRPCRPSRVRPSARQLLQLLRSGPRFRPELWRTECDEPRLIIDGKRNFRSSEQLTVEDVDNDQNDDEIILMKLGDWWKENEDSYEAAEIAGRVVDAILELSNEQSVPAAEELPVRQTKVTVQGRSGAFLTSHKPRDQDGVKWGGIRRRRRDVGKRIKSRKLFLGKRGDMFTWNSAGKATTTSSYNDRWRDPSVSLSLKEISSMALHAREAKQQSWSPYDPSKNVNVTSYKQDEKKHSKPIDQEATSFGQALFNFHEGNPHLTALGLSSKSSSTKWHDRKASQPWSPDHTRYTDTSNDDDRKRRIVAQNRASMLSRENNLQRKRRATSNFPGQVVTSRHQDVLRDAKAVKRTRRGNRLETLATDVNGKRNEEAWNASNEEFEAGFNDTAVLIGNTTSTDRLIIDKVVGKMRNSRLGRLYFLGKRKADSMDIRRAR